MHGEFLNCSSLHFLRKNLPLILEFIYSAKKLASRTRGSTCLHLSEVFCCTKIFMLGVRDTNLESHAIKHELFPSPRLLF